MIKKMSTGFDHMMFAMFFLKPQMFLPLVHSHLIELLVRNCQIGDLFLDGFLLIGLEILLDVSSSQCLPPFVVRTFFVNLRLDAVWRTRARRVIP